jgi:hypothetical protein
MHEVARWPLREALLAYVARMKEEAIVSHRHETLVWAFLAPYQKKSSKPPPVPRILRKG